MESTRLRPPEQTAAPGGNGHPAFSLPLRRQRRVSVALVAVLIAIASALGFIVWAGSLAQRTPVVAVARTINAGDVIGRADLTTVRVAADAGVATLPSSELDRLVGKVATTPLFKGTLLNRSQVSRSAPLPDDEAIVGVLVKAGQAPLASLRVGTTVQVVQTAGPSSVGGEPPEVLADDVTVYAVSQPSGQDAVAAGLAGGVLVSLRVPRDAAAAIVSAADAERIRLVVVGSVSR